MQQFFNKIDSCDMGYKNNISVSEVAAALSQQKNGKSAGPNGITMESLVFGGVKVSIHLSLLFNVCSLFVIAICQVHLWILLLYH